MKQVRHSTRLELKQYCESILVDKVGLVDRMSKVGLVDRMR